MKVRSTLPAKTRISYLFVLLSLSLATASCRDDLASPRRCFLADWSPDGTRLALVPDTLDDKPGYSGLWIYDSTTGQIVQPIPETDTRIYLHPRWSPDGTQILVAAVDEQEKDSDGDGESIPYSVDAVDARTLLRRRAVDSVTTSGEAFLIPNTIMWGADPNTVIYQWASGDKVTAMQLDLNSGISSQYLQDSADRYCLQPSPDRRHIVSVLYDTESQVARVYLSDFETINWRLVETLSMDQSTVESGAPTINWAPDSSAFILREKVEQTPGTEKGRQYLRLFEIRRGLSRRIGAFTGSSAIIWNRDSTAILFSDDNPVLGEGIFRLDLAFGIERMIAPGRQYTLLSWNQDDDRIYFCRTVGQDQDEQPGNPEILEHRLFYCDGEGEKARSLGRFYTGAALSPILSPHGNRMILYDDPIAPGYLNLTSGDGQPIPLEPK